MVNKIIKVVAVLPDKLYSKLRVKFNNTGHNWLAAQCDMERIYTKRFKEKTDFKECCVINRGLYDYQYFNICFMNNMLASIVKCHMNGVLPEVGFKNDAGINIWEQFFEQPCGVGENLRKTPVDFECGELFPKFDEIYDKQRVKRWHRLYSRYIKLNKTSRKYIGNELKELDIKNRRVLGVLCRGTDYLKLRPKGHPVQPEISTVLKDTEEKLKEWGCDYIYLATEDSKIQKQFKDKFGDRVLENKRVYYDKVFDKDGLDFIKDVHFERENDDYLKGLEYISSMYILSRCDNIIAGNCGGSQFAVFMNGGRYNNSLIYNYGLYE
ncbi:MAG: hypothetical protein K6G11_05815 [Lachnospiraceae bacterium]|nr:hypothetical protein [Lachnospiraceae bacterium]